MGRDIMNIAINPQEYSDFVSKKAERAATVAGSYSATHYDPARPVRFFSYQLGDETVGLLRAGGPVRIKGETFREKFGRNDLTSVVDLRVTHPLVENAGDILLEPPRVTSNSSGCGQSNSSTREAGQGTVSLSLFPGQELQRLL
ncbi:hypothetical protein ABIF66_003708 [Bradyrhizobium japonicum]